MKVQTLAAQATEITGLTPDSFKYLSQGEANNLVAAAERKIHAHFGPTGDYFKRRLVRGRVRTWSQVALLPSSRYTTAAPQTVLQGA